MADNTTSEHHHFFDTQFGYRHIGDSILMSCACGATRLFSPAPTPEKKPGKLLHFPSSIPPEQPSDGPAIA